MAVGAKIASCKNRLKQETMEEVSVMVCALNNDVLVVAITAGRECVCYTNRSEKCGCKGWQRECYKQNVCMAAGSRIASSDGMCYVEWSVQTEVLVGVSCGCHNWLRVCFVL